MAITAKNEINKLIIPAYLETPTPSASGKTLVVASTRRNKEIDVIQTCFSRIIFGIAPTSFCPCMIQSAFCVLVTILTLD
jgi:hypothetical protein